MGALKQEGFEFGEVEEAPAHKESSRHFVYRFGDAKLRRWRDEPAYRKQILSWARRQLVKNKLLSVTLEEYYGKHCRRVFYRVTAH